MSTEQILKAKEIYGKVTQTGKAQLTSQGYNTEQMFCFCKQEFIKKFMKETFIKHCRQATAIGPMNKCVAQNGINDDDNYFYTSK